MSAPMRLNFVAALVGVGRFPFPLRYPVAARGPRAFRVGSGEPIIELLARVSVVDINTLKAPVPFMHIGYWRTWLQPPSCER